MQSLYKEVVYPCHGGPSDTRGCPEGAASLVLKFF
jgi:hypothetical protein